MLGLLQSIYDQNTLCTLLFLPLVIVVLQYIDAVLLNNEQSCSSDHVAKRNLVLYVADEVEEAFLPTGNSTN